MAIDLKSLKPISASASASELDLCGTWTNELGSQMEIENYTPADGNFSGNYSSAVSGQGPPVSGPLSGTISEGAIAFFVNWGSGSLTAWAGLILDAGNGSFVFYTLWHLAGAPQNPDQWWESVLTGADLFYKTVPGAAADRGP